ncbi:EF-hand domain-containing protein [Vreelandella sp. EE7]
MAQNYKTGLIITGDASGGIRAIKATDDELGKLNKGFDRGSRRSRQFNQDMNATSQGLTMLRRAAAPVAGAIAGMFAANTIKSQIDFGASLADINTRLGASAEALSQYNYVAKLSGVEFGQLTTAWQRQTRRIAEAATGTGVASKALERLNLNAKELSQLAPEDQFERIATAMQSVESSSERVALAQKLWDSEGVKLVQVVNQGTESIAAMRAEADALGLTISNETASAMGAYNAEVDRLSFAAQGLSQSIASELIPSITQGLQATNAFIQEAGGASSILNEIKDVAALAAVVVAGRYAGAFAASAKKLAANTAETYTNAQANAAATQAAARRTAAEKQSAMAMLSTARLEEQATRGTAAHALALDNLSRARAQAATAAGAHTAATNANALAMQRNTVSAYAMAAASRAASASLALIGGPVGAAVLAGTAAYYFRDSLGFTSAAARETTQDIDQLTDSLDNYTRAQYESNRVSIVQDLAEARIEAEKLSRQILELQDQSRDEGVIYQGRGGAATSQLPALRAELQEQQRIVRANEEGLRKYDQAWKDVLESQISGVSIFRTLDQWLMTNGDSASETSRRFNALGDSLGEGDEKWDDYIAKLQAARDVMGMTAAESAQYAAAQAGYKGLYADQAAAVAGQTDALSDYQKAVADGNETEAQAHLARAQRYAEAEAMVQAQLQNIDTLTTLLQGVQTELSATALSAALVVGDGSGAAAANVAAAIEAINNRAAAIRNTTTVTVKNTAANREASKAAREAEQAAQKQADALQSIREEMDPLLRDHATYVDRITVLEKALAAGTITQKDFGDAVRWSAEQYTRAASGAEDYENQTESLVSKYDAHNQRAKLLRTELEQINQRYRTGIYDGDQYGRMVQNVRDEMDQLAKEADGNSDRIAQSFTTWGTVADNTLRSVDDAGRDAWLGLVDGSTSARETIERGFEQTLANIGHMLSTQQLTFYVSGVMGMDSTGMPGGGGGGFNLGSMGSIRNGWQAVQSGVGNIQWTGAGGQQAYGGGWANAATQGTGASGYLGGSMQNFSGMQGLASAGTGFAGGYAGTQMGQSLFGKNAGSSWGATGGAVAGTYFGGPLGAAIGGAIGGALDAAFGSGKSNPRLNVSTYGEQSAFSHDSIATSALGTIGFGQGTRRSDEMFGSVEKEREWLASYAALDNMMASLAETPAQLEEMQRAAQGFHVSVGTAAEASARMNDRTVTIAATIDGYFAASLRKAGINAEQMTARVVDAAQAMNLVDSASERLNLNYDKNGHVAMHWADAMAQQAGGVENLASLQSSYYQQFFSEAERAANLQDDLTRALNAMGMALPENEAGFRRLVEAQRQHTAAGSQNYVQLLQLSDGFSELQRMLGKTEVATDAATDAQRRAEEAARAQEEHERTKGQLETRYLNMLGTREAELELRARELNSIDESNRWRLEYIHALEDEQAAQKAAEQAQQERTRAIEKEAQAWANARDQLTNFGNSISGWVAQLNATDTGGGTPRSRLEASDADFWAQYEKALGGDRNAQQGLTQYADRYINNLQEMYASSAPAAAGIAEIRDAMERLPEMLSPEQFLADEFRGIIGEQTGVLAGRVDLNGDGTVSALEQTIAANWSTTELLSGVLNTEMNRLGTTVLTEAQVRKALAPHATDAEIDRLIREVDTNGDGMINRQELTNARLAGLEGGFARAIATEFDRIDIDASGFIDYNEFRRAFAGMATDAELRRIFGKLDKDGSGTISRLEAINSTTGRVSSNTGRIDSNTGNIDSRARNSQTGMRVTLTHGQPGDVLSQIGWVFGQQMHGWSARIGQEHAIQMRRQGIGNSGTPYWAGGYTGPGGKYQPAGTVHAGEIVWSQDDITRAGGVDNVEALRLGTASAAVLQMQLPDAPLPMPTPVLPMSQHSLLGQSDQVEAWRDLLNENRHLRQDVNRLLGKIEQHTGAGVAVQQEGFKQQINEQRKGNRSLDDMSAAARLEGSR